MPRPPERVDASGAGVSGRERASVNPAPARLRSLLFAPASKPDVLRKMPRAEPDGVALDLEDAVPADGKADARVHSTRSAPSWRPRTRSSRSTCG